MAAAAFNNRAQTLAGQDRLEEALDSARKAVSLRGASQPAAPATLRQIPHPRR